VRKHIMAEKLNCYRP